MVVLKIDVHGIGAAEFKRNAPVSRHADAPGAFPVTGQRVQAPTGDVQLFRGRGLIQSIKDASCSRGLSGIDPASVVFLEVAGQPLVPEAFDHGTL